MTALFTVVYGLCGFLTGVIVGRWTRERVYGRGFEAGWAACKYSIIPAVETHLACQEQDRRAVADYERHTAGVN